MFSLFRVLKVGLKYDVHLVEAFIASVANRLYSADEDYKLAGVRRKNCVLTLGHIAVNMMELEGVTASVLSILQQRFCRPPSHLDSNIIDQFAGILMTGHVSKFCCKLYFMTMSFLFSTPLNQAPPSKNITLAKL